VPRVDLEPGRPSWGILGLPFWQTRPPATGPGRPAGVRHRTV